MARIKILFLDHTPIPGGAQICLATDIKYLNRQKFEPLLAIDRTSKFAGIYKDSKVKIHKINFGKLKSLNPLNALKNFYQSYIQFKTLVNTLNPDIVFANTTRALILAAVAKGDYKLISFIRDYDYPKSLIKLLKPKVDKFLAVSKSIKDFYKINADVVYLGSDLHTQKVSSKKLQYFKKRLKIGDKDLAVGFVGRLVDWKGADVLLKAFTQINNPHIKLLFFGTGQNQKGSIGENFKFQISNFKLSNKIKMVGFIDKPALIFKSIDIFVLPSKKPEPFSTSMIEAALSKVPIIATNTGGTSEFIKHQKNGLLIEANNPNELQKSLLRLITDKAFAKKLAKQAYIDSQKFDEKIFIKKLEKIFHGLKKS